MVNFQQGGLLDVDTEWKVMMIDMYNFTVLNTNNLHVIWNLNIWLIFLNICYIMTWIKQSPKFMRFYRQCPKPNFQLLKFLTYQQQDLNILYIKNYDQHIFA